MPCPAGWEWEGEGAGFALLLLFGLALEFGCQGMQELSLNLRGILMADPLKLGAGEAVRDFCTKLSLFQCPF